ncbi:hypothetical protein MRI28_18895 [Nocardiopsis dassonvillei]|uniref:hypothetical protein n=1 Tax=Nocardiopsis dassonvillei TaxID=2014 RepID=UPI00200CD8D5|nr:hypothetical protein [Nocardiopsis dassonvillei]MCK9871680.1 hypothetical protein [Nocardiopsis dassonvillei]
MHQPPNVRRPSYTDLYGPGFGVMVVCWITSFLLLIVLAVAKGLHAVMRDLAWFGVDPAWADASATFSDNLGTALLVPLPVLNVLALLLTASLDAVHPKNLPPWTTREQLREARVLSSNAVMGGDPWTNFLARVHAGVHLRSFGWVLPRWGLVSYLVLNGLMTGNGVFMLVRGFRNEDPALMAIGLNNISLFAGFAVFALALRARRQRMRAFCDLYDAAQRRMVR